ncbi:hypothetical protein CBER1_07267 [Cercospora berteroae]|uniref:Uncharacterized protein n=1 Tax=Cercospora berteroae TaxID=357750 RepID=A0A2S6BTP0_9PEZI|nr:hypothetical protein CBER1_07267 [Cercospora berteroae]
MSGYPSRRPVSPMGGYYDIREVRPSGYERERDAENLTRYGTPRRANDQPSRYTSERRHPESRTRRYEEDYGAAGIDLSTFGGGPGSSYGGGLSSRAGNAYPYSPPPAYSSVRANDTGYAPRRESRPFDSFARRPPPRPSPMDELDLLDAAARRSRPSTHHRSPRRSPLGSDMPTAEEFAAVNYGRGNYYPTRPYDGSRQPSSRSHRSERRPPCLASPTEGHGEGRDLQLVSSNSSARPSLKQRILNRVLKNKKTRPSDILPASEATGAANDQTSKSNDKDLQSERYLSYEDYLIHTRPRDVWLPLDPSVSPSDPAFKAAVKASQS